MRKFDILFIFCLISTLVGFAQNIDSIFNNTETEFGDSIANYNLKQKHLKLSRDAYNNGIQYFELTNFTDAIKSFSEAISMDSLFISAYYNRGISFLEITEYDRAIKDFSTTLTLDSTNLLALFKRAKSFRKQLAFYRKIQ